MRSSTSGVMTSFGVPSATILLVDRHQVRQVRSHPVEVVGGEHDRDAVLVQVCQQVQHVVPGADVDAGRRLVEHQQAGVAQQSAGQEHPLLLAAGELADVPLGKLGDAQTIQHRGNVGLVGAAGPRPLPALRCGP